MLPPRSTGELANTVDKHIFRCFARISNINDEALEKNSEILSLPISEGGKGLKRLNWMKEGAHVASWLQCATRVDELIGEAVPQMRNWKEAALPCQQAVKLAHSNMVDNEGVDAIKIAGTSMGNTAPSHAAPKLQKAIALKVMAIRRDRWFVEANERQQQVALSGSTRNQRSGAGAWVKAAPASEKTTMLNQPYERAVCIRMGLPLAPPNSTCKVYLKNQSRLCGKEISVWADHAHSCAKAARNTGHNHIRDWWAGVLANCGDRVETEQFVSEYEPEKKTARRCPSDPRRGRTSDILRHSGNKPMDNGNARGSRERKQRTTARRQSGESSRNQQDARLHAAAKHAICTHHPDGFQCLRKVVSKGGTRAVTSSKKKAGKT